jgi:hypothetical protein
MWVLADARGRVGRLLACADCGAARGETWRGRAPATTVGAERPGCLRRPARRELSRKVIAAVTTAATVTTPINQTRLRKRDDLGPNLIVRGGCPSNVSGTHMKSSNGSHSCRVVAACLVVEGTCSPSRTSVDEVMLLMPRYMGPRQINCEPANCLGSFAGMTLAGNAIVHMRLSPSYRTATFADVAGVEVSGLAVRAVSRPGPSLARGSAPCELRARASRLLGSRAWSPAGCVVQA